MRTRLGSIFLVMLVIGLAATGCGSQQPVAQTTAAAPATASALAVATQAPAVVPTTVSAAAESTTAVATQAPAAAAVEIKGLVKPGYLTVADTGKAPPNTLTSADGKPEGAWIDLCNQWAQDLGLKLEVVYLDWPGVLPGLQAGKFDIAGSVVLRTPARLASKDFIMSDPFNAEGVMLMVKKDSGIKTWDDMKGKKLGIIRGEQEGVVAVDRVGKIVADTTEYPGKQEGMLEILNGRIDGFAAGGSGLAYMLKTAPQGDQLTLVGPALSIADEGVAIRKELPELAKGINGLIAKYMSDGTLDKIYSKWYGTPNPVDTLRDLQKNPELAAPQATATPTAATAVATQAPAAAAVEIKGLVKPGYLTVADTGKAPPNTLTSADGKPEGAWIDLCNQWAQDLGLKLEVVYLDWPGVLPGLQAGKFDIAGSAVLRTPARLASKDFIMSDPFNAEGVMLMVKKDSGIKTWDDMKGKKLGIIRGEQEGVVAVDRVGKIVADTTEYPGKQEGMLEILNGRIDGFAAGGSGLAYMLKTAPQGDQLTLVGPALSIADEGVAIRKELPELAKGINGLIAKYMSDGTLDKIYSKWYGTPNPVDTLRDLQKNPELAAPQATATPSK